MLTAGGSRAAVVEVWWMVVGTAARPPTNVAVWQYIVRSSDFVLSADQHLLRVDFVRYMMNVWDSVVCQ